MKKTMMAMALIMTPFSGAMATEVRSDIFQINPMEWDYIDKHGVCRKVQNVGTDPVMIGTDSASEWSVGTASFIVNSPNMDHIVLRSCPESEPKPK